MKKITYYYIISSFFFMNLNSQEVYIQGGGTLDDWANLSMYAKSNKELINSSDKNRVVFMGNSITQGWSNFDPNFTCVIYFENKDENIGKAKTSKSSRKKRSVCQVKICCNSLFGNKNYAFVQKDRRNW